MKLNSARVLLEEDNFIILMDLETIMMEAGAQIVGSCRTVEAALSVAMNGDINAALLDIRLGQQTIFPVARCLAQRGIPFAFYTAQAQIDSTLAEWPESPVLGKPAPPSAIVAAVAHLVRSRTLGDTGPITGRD
jgi:DNA-binding NtrC family response regulator